jgi:hypothetical protein
MLWGLACFYSIIAFSLLVWGCIYTYSALKEDFREGIITKEEYHDDIKSDILFVILVAIFWPIFLFIFFIARHD